jgi:hypothetical protein
MNKNSTSPFFDAIIKDFPYRNPDGSYNFTFPIIEKINSSGIVLKHKELIKKLREKENLKKRIDFNKLEFDERLLIPDAILNEANTEIQSKDATISELQSEINTTGKQLEFLSDSGIPVDSEEEPEITPKTNNFSTKMKKVKEFAGMVIIDLFFIFIFLGFYRDSMSEQTLYFRIGAIVLISFFVLQFKRAWTEAKSAKPQRQLLFFVSTALYLSAIFGILIADAVSPAVEVATINEWSFDEVSEQVVKPNFWDIYRKYAGFVECAITISLFFLGGTLFSNNNNPLATTQNQSTEIEQDPVQFLLRKKRLSEKKLKKCEEDKNRIIAERDKNYEESIEAIAKKEDEILTLENSYFEVENSITEIENIRKNLLEMLLCDINHYIKTIKEFTAISGKPVTIDTVEANDIINFLNVK